MKNALYLFNKEVEALKNYVTDNTSFSVNVDVSSYPVKISFFEECRQSSFFDKPDANASDRAAELQFIFYDKMQIKTKEDISIPEEVFNKLKTLSKEVNRLFLNAYFAKFNAFEKRVLETFDRRKGVSKIADVKADWRGKQRFLAVVTPKDIIDSIFSETSLEV